MDEKIRIIMLNLLKPMKDLGNWNYSETQAVFLAENLPSMSAAKLQHLAKHLVSTKKFTPKMAEILAAAKPTITSNEGVGDYQNKQAEKEKENHKQCTLYVDDFLRTNSIAHTAAKEGWYKELSVFATETARTMQRIAASKDKPIIAWSGSAVPRDFWPIYEKMLHSKASSIKASRSYDVMDAMPVDLPEYWRARSVVAA